MCVSAPLIGEQRGGPTVIQLVVPSSPELIRSLMSMNILVNNLKTIVGTIFRLVANCSYRMDSGMRKICRFNHMKEEFAKRLDRELVLHGILRQNATLF